MTYLWRRSALLYSFVLFFSFGAITFAGDGLPGGCVSGIPQISSRAMPGFVGEDLIRQTPMACGGSCYTSKNEYRDGMMIYQNVIKDNFLVGHLSYFQKNDNSIKIMFAAVAPEMQGNGLYRGLYGEMENTVDLTGSGRVTTSYELTNAEVYEQNLAAVKALHPELHDDEAMSVAAARTPGGRQLAKRQLWPRPSGGNGDFEFTSEPLSAYAMKAHANLSSMSNEEVAAFARPKPTCPVVRLKADTNKCKVTGTSVVTTTPPVRNSRQASGMRAQIRSGVGRATANIGVRVVDMMVDGWLVGRAKGGDKSASDLLDARAYSGRVQQNLSEGRNADGTPATFWKSILNSLGQTAPM